MDSQISRVDGGKIDTEGAEPLVIRGARHTIEIDRPWLVVEYEGQYISDLAKREQTLKEMETLLPNMEILRPRSKWKGHFALQGYLMTNIDPNEDFDVCISNDSIFL